MSGTITPGGPPGPNRHVDPLPVQVARPMVLLRLGYRRPSQVPEKITRLIDEIMERGRSLLEPKAVWSEVEVTAPEPGLVVLGGAVRTRSRSVHDRFSTCRTAAVFAATIGPGIDRLGHEWMEAGEMTRALLIDAYGSSAATALGLELELVVAVAFEAKGLEVTKRYAPGYGDWDLGDQAPLLSLLDVASIGVTLTEDHLMLPAKSISGVIGGR